MFVYTTPLAALFFLLCQYNCLGLYTGEQAVTPKEEAQAIQQVVQDAVEYHDWVSEPGYREKLSRMYDGELLNNIIDSVEQFKSVSTDWHYLTFIRKCHIVYNNGNTAMVTALLEETNYAGDCAGRGMGTFYLHKTDQSWRIIGMDITWLDNNENTKHN